MRSGREGLRTEGTTIGNSTSLIFKDSFADNALACHALKRERPALDPEIVGVAPGNVDRAKIIIVDRQSASLRALHRLLEDAGYDVMGGGDGEGVLGLMQSERPALLVLTVAGPNDIALCAELKGLDATRLTPIILLTHHHDAALRLGAIRAGADDLLTRPVPDDELLARIRALVRFKAYADSLEDAQQMMFALARCVEARDQRTAGHCARLADFTVRMAQRLALGAQEIDALRKAGYLHDLGKLMVPDAILNKVGPLDTGEWEIMRRHPVEGERLCAPFKTLRLVLPIIRHHHERMDGSGYPDGLSGDAIPMTARVLQVADVYDALVQARSYKPALRVADALAVLQDEVQRGFWDSRVFDALCSEVADNVSAGPVTPSLSALRR